MFWLFWWFLFFNFVNLLVLYVVVWVVCNGDGKVFVLFCVVCIGDLFSCIIIVFVFGFLGWFFMEIMLWVIFFLVIFILLFFIDLKIFFFFENLDFGLISGFRCCFIFFLLLEIKVWGKVVLWYRVCFLLIKFNSFCLNLIIFLFLFGRFEINFLEKKVYNKRYFNMK